MISAFVNVPAIAVNALNIDEKSNLYQGYHIGGDIGL